MAALRLEAIPRVASEAEVLTCAHAYVNSVQPCYVKCATCGTYRSTNSLPPELIYTGDYWTHAKGHSTIEEQVWNVDGHREGGKTKNEFILERIEVKDRESALEIGCAPGKLLLLLRGIAGFDRVVGVEACAGYERDIREIGCFGGELVFGLYPTCTATVQPEEFNLIVALDLFEHIHEPEEFLTESARLLKQGGQLLLMLPLAEECHDRFFEPSEHVWIFSKQHMANMLWESGFALTGFDLWTAGHSTVSARKL